MKQKQLLSMLQYIDMDDKPETIIGALHNADVERPLAALVKAELKGLLNGLKIFQNLLGAKKAILVVPEHCLNEACKLAEEYNVELIAEEFLQVRAFEHAVCIHYSTLLNADRCSTAKEPCRWLSINGQPLREVSCSISLSALIPEEKVKAIRIGHGFYPPDILNKRLDEIEFIEDGCIDVLQDNDCLVQAVLQETQNLRNVSCGICTFCREGLFQVESTLKGLQKPGTDKAQLELMKELGEAMICSGLCSVGAQAAVPVLTALEHFSGELSAHCGKGKCPAGACKAFLDVFIDPQKCEGCGDCIDVCPEDCIEGKSGYISMIDEFDCSKCGKCVDVCPNGAAQFSGGRKPKLPERLTKVGRFKK